MKPSKSCEVTHSKIGLNTYLQFIIQEVVSSGQASIFGDIMSGTAEIDRAIMTHTQAGGIYLCIEVPVIIHILAMEIFSNRCCVVWSSGMLIVDVIQFIGLSKQRNTVYGMERLMSYVKAIVYLPVLPVDAWLQCSTVPVRLEAVFICGFDERQYPTSKINFCLFPLDST